MRSTFLAIYLVETVGPVDTHHTHHGEEDADTHAGRTLDVEWLEVLDVLPRVTAFEGCEAVDGGGGLEQEREVKLDAESGVGTSASLIVGGELAVVVTAEGDGLLSIGVGA